jgi:hypothetical protein
MLAVHHLHGAATRIPVEATAFGLRREHYLVEIVSAWDGGTEEAGDCHQQWARSVSDWLAPTALPGGYPNLLGPDDHAQNDLAFGPNIDRLQDVKRRFDPYGSFSAITLPDRGKRGATVNAMAAFSAPSSLR